MDRLTLTGAERTAMEEVIAEAVADLELREPLRFADRAVPLAARVPVRLREFLAEVRTGESDVAVVSGLPVEEDLLPTPAGWQLAHRTSAGWRTELVLLLCGAALAEPFGWTSQQNGRIVHDVCPAPEQERSLTSGSSSVSLALHTEDVFDPCRADYVALFCLRNPDAVSTTLARVAALDLPDELRKVLAEDRFRFYGDDSHTGERSRRAWSTGPVVFGPAERPYLRFDEDFVEALEGDAEAAAALKFLRELCLGAIQDVVLRPGEVLFLDNYRVVHGRAAFAARYDGRDRWLKRVNLIRDVRRLYTTRGRTARVV